TAVSFVGRGRLRAVCGLCALWARSRGRQGGGDQTRGSVIMQQHNNYVHSRSERTIIASRSNPIVKAIRGLSSHKEREHSGLFFVDGLHLVAAATQQQAEIETCVVAPELLTSAFGRELARALAERGARMVDVTADVFHSLAAKEHAQGIGVV